MKGFIFLVVAGMAMYFILMVMGTAWSFGAGGGNIDINIMTNEARSLNGEAIAIQGDRNTIAYVKDRGEVALPYRDDGGILIAFVVLIVFGFGVISGVLSVIRPDDDGDEWPDDVKHYR